MTTPGITAARAATSEIEQLLQPAIDQLQGALTDRRPSGVFTDVDAVLAGIVELKRAIDYAQAIARRTDWPLSPTARRRVLQSLTAGLAQQRAPGLPTRRRGVESSPRSTPPDEAAP